MNLAEHDRWTELRFNADLLRLDVDVAEAERLAGDYPVIPTEPDQRADAALARLLRRVS